VISQNSSISVGKRGIAAQTVGDGNVLVTGDNNRVSIYQSFIAAPAPLARHIRVREFESLITERTAGFVGRDFIFQAIDVFFSDPAFPGGYIIIRGEPGIGKSALIGELVNRRGWVHHFNIASQNIRTARDFLGNICAQLIARYQLDYAALPSEALQDSGFLSKLLHEAAHKADHRPVVVLVDALDEAEDVGLPADANRLYLPSSVPPGVFLVVTSREEHDFRLHVDRREDIYLRDDSPENLADVRQYISRYIAMHPSGLGASIQLWGVSEQEFIAILTEKSQGNFMYLVHVLRDIDKGLLTMVNIENIRKLPQGLRAYYQRHWRTMQDQDPARFEKYYQPVVCLLATVREPVSISDLAQWTHLDLTAITQVIQTWREFLNEDEDQSGVLLYRVYHASFQDFLQDEVGLKPYHNLIALTALDKIPGFEEGAGHNPIAQQRK
jgi:hypothetical protein